MKTCLVWAAAAVVVCSAAGAQAGLLGAGVTAFGGVNIPVAQDDAASGTVFGLRVPLQAISILRVEPWLGLAKSGDYTIDAPISGPQSFPGTDITTFGINALLGTPMTAPSLSIAFVAGLGTHKVKPEGFDSDSRVGFNGGLDIGAALGAAPVSLSGRAELLVIPLDGGGSRKNVFLTAGLTYKFGI